MLFSLAPAEPTAAKTTEQAHQKKKKQTQSRQETNNNKATEPENSKQEATYTDQLTASGRGTRVSKIF